MNKNESKSFKSPALAAALWAFLTVLLLLPVWLAMQHIVQAPPRWTVLVGALGLSLVLCGITGLFRRRWAWWLATGVLLLLLWLRMVHFGLVEFSGAGFTREFFIHMEWRSAVIAWEEYPAQFRRAALLLFLGAAALALVARAGSIPGRASAAALTLLGIFCIAIARPGMPEADLLQAWQQWTQPIAMEASGERLAVYESSGLLEGNLVPKFQVTAQAPAQPKNLILLYLESGGFKLADQPHWPGLMPHYEALLEQHAWVDHLWTSSFITIEGLTNSMCGTLFPYLRGSDSMAEGEGLAENLTCLADVLAQAGYYQMYMGGADLSFAGKGDFLIAHGYDEARGIEYWRDQGLDQRPDTWGLSDADLYEQSISELRKLHDQGTPFNLTLLTIGTHLPGYHYSECTPYPGSDNRFLQALHCTDQLLGRWMEQLQDQGLLEDTLLVITADHHVFPNPEMRSLFGDDVFDRRLPLIVLGDDIPAPLSRHGAGYDLAPTLLDLLEIEHNATFLLGRSLLRPPARPDYFLTRYPDIYAGKDVNNHRPGNADQGCGENTGGRLRLPLNDCEKAEILNTLNARVLELSAQTWPISCDPLVQSHVAIPEDGSQPIEVTISNRSQADRFIFQGRRVAPDQPGLFLMQLDAIGQVMARRFYPATAGGLASIELPVSQDDEQMANLVLAWRPAVGGGIYSAVIGDMVQLELGDKPFIQLLDSRGGQVTAATTLLNLSAALCPAPADAFLEEVLIDSQSPQ